MLVLQWGILNPQVFEGHETKMLLPFLGLVGIGNANRGRLWQLENEIIDSQLWLSSYKRR